jgi:hypothetical protein
LKIVDRRFSFSAPAPMPSGTEATQSAAVSDSAAVNEISPESRPKLQEIVKFMFGLIAVGEFTPLDGYLETIDQMLTSTVGDETKKAMTFDYPAVLSIKIDCKSVLNRLTSLLPSIYSLSLFAIHSKFHASCRSNRYCSEISDCSDTLCATRQRDRARHKTANC